MRTWIEQARQGNRRALARLLSLVEDSEEQARRIIPLIYPHTGQAHLIGITGAPGSGKSTLVAQIAAAYRRRGMTVAIVAVDPSSPFSGGAILGDRIRMQRLAGDSGVFVRSMASRGRVGGLARGTLHVVQVLDACGYQRILIETVGAGQSEVDIVRTAHTTLVLQVPGMGDDIQTMKAGILEIADILVVNKADFEGATRTIAMLEAMLSLDPRSRAQKDGAWMPPIIKTVAPRDEGTAELIDTIERHMSYLHQSGRMITLERERAAEELRAILREEMLARALQRIGEARFAEALTRAACRKVDPYTIVQAWMNNGILGNQ